MPDLADLLRDTLLDDAIRAELDRDPDTVFARYTLTEPERAALRVSVVRVD